jgi:hypothetical protein
MTAFTRTFRPQTRTAVRALISSADPPERRAENIMAVLGITTGDADAVARHHAELTEMLRQYAEIDREAGR